MLGYSMALDRPDEDARPDPPERHFRPDEADRTDGVGRGGGAGARAEMVEPRTRGECYEALRAAVGGPDDERSSEEHSGDERSGGERSVAGDSCREHSGWDSVDAADRPALEAIRVSAERRVHILDGDPGGGGGHRHGVGKPDKTEFPASWDDKKIIGNVLDVARRPDSAPVLQHWNDRWICSGIRASVEVSVIVLRSGEVWTAWPEEGGPGVIRNPKKGSHD